jgi:hypothetical protein
MVATTINTPVGAQYTPASSGRALGVLPAPIGAQEGSDHRDEARSAPARLGQRPRFVAIRDRVRMARFLVLSAST